MCIWPLLPKIQQLLLLPSTMAAEKLRKGREEGRKTESFT
jgi:hypothetical protein